mmetsp:Transcript_7938/g.16107  ORF Transcript_7938/g.16107 Transcript_7938/m.16107 type:complete len:154 (-) Transcript_7938:282-743(-)
MADSIQIVAFVPEYQKAFRDLNEEWISQYFKMEEKDYNSLDHPQEYIIDKGGYIAIALFDGVPVGACALLKIDNGYELAKMGVSPTVHGKGIGKLLGNHVVNKARELGAARMYIESNRMLVPAITLYEKLGFKEVQGFVSPYERCDIQMELIL